VLRPVPIADITHILERSERLWRELRGQHLFITGGTGFFGIWLLEAVRAANERLGSRISTTVLSRDPAAFVQQAPHLANQPALHWHRGDVRNFAFPQARCDHIIHAATESSAALNASRPDIMLDAIVNGTKRVLEFAQSSAVTSVLLTSSGAVYGRQPEQLSRIPESFAGGPDINSSDSAYAEGKRMAELLCAITAEQRGVSIKVARCFSFVGPHLPLDAHFAAGNFLRDSIAGRPIIINGDGTPRRSYMHPADLVIWLLTILCDGQSSRPYNVGSDEEVSIFDLASRIAALSGGNCPVVIRRELSDRSAQDYVPQTERARHELGLETTIDLNQTLRRTLIWLKEERE